MRMIVIYALCVICLGGCAAKSGQGPATDKAYKSYELNEIYTVRAGERMLVHAYSNTAPVYTATYRELVFSTQGSGTLVLVYRECARIRQECFLEEALQIEEKEGAIVEHRGIRVQVLESGEESIRYAVIGD